MAFYGKTSWTPLEGGDGDLGTTYRPVDLSHDDTEYYGHGGGGSRGDSSSQLSPYHDGYELNDLSE